MLTALGSCSYFEPYTEPPVYIRIDSIPFRDSLASTAGIPGRNLQRITDAWVFADGEYVGAFEIPATIPIRRKRDNMRITIEPGIISDGINGYRVSYAFFKRFDQAVPLVQGQVTAINFTTTYNTGNNAPRQPFPVLYAFEGSGDSTLFLGTNTVGTARTTGDPNLILKDGGIGSWILRGPSSGSGGTMEYQSRTIFRLPQDLSPIFVELHYRSTIPVQVGLFGQGDLGANVAYDLTLLPTNGEWRKIYVSLSEEMSNLLNVIGTRNTNLYRIRLRALSTGKPDEYVLLDNVKLLHLNR